VVRACRGCEEASLNTLQKTNAEKSISVEPKIEVTPFAPMMALPFAA